MQNVISKMVNAYVSGKLNYSPEELSDIITITINYHIERSTTEIKVLESAYGESTDSSTYGKVQYYAHKLFSGVSSNNEKDVQLFWSLFNEMNLSLITSYSDKVLSNIQ